MTVSTLAAPAVRSPSLEKPVPPGEALSGACVPVRLLDRATRAGMLALLERHYDGVCREDFERDLDEKDRVILVTDGTGAVRGFSTLLAYRSAATGRRVLFSGDTIVDPVAWRSPVAIRTWLRSALAAAAEAPGDPLDWFLIASGHRTYRVMATLFRRHHPAAGEAAPDLADRLALVARERYGARFDAATGVIRLERSVHRLKPGVGDVTEARLRDPAVELFARLDPGHARGDELACLCEVSPENLSGAGRRLLRG
ncbi:MAG: hypothetical protein U0229_17130 [Anaeromyxobacter sp.]